MSCCCSLDLYEQHFNDQDADDELRAYRERGPARTTRLLLDTITAQGLTGASLLDIGGGIGAIQHELIGAGVVSRAVDVDASTAYLRTAREEAERRGHADQITFSHGDFVALADQIEPADIVTLDRVICCYPDMEALVRLSVERARRVYALVYPRGGWWVRAASRVVNLGLRLAGRPLPIYIHPTQAVNAIITAGGFRPLAYQRLVFWQVVVYGRAAAGS
jgi:magnesium-protoporphyrin O-methyltransferase